MNGLNLFILGAGFTKAVFPSAPLNDELLYHVVGEKPDTSPLGRIWSKYGSNNIEMLLTKFDLDTVAEQRELNEERKAINAQIAAFFTRFRFQGDIKWLHPLLKVISDSDVILSLNYDCFLEGFLDFHCIWSPKGGYHCIRNRLDDNLPENDKNIRILKLHGSENFRVSPFFDKPESFVVEIEINKSLFPRSGRHSSLGGGIGSWPYLIAPSFAKHFVLEVQYLILDAIRFAHVAQNLVIIGCALRPEDGHLWMILTNFMKTPRWKRKRTIILSHNASQLGERITRYWGRKIFNEHNLVCINCGLKEGLTELNKLLQSTRSNNSSQPTLQRKVESQK